MKRKQSIFIILLVLVLAISAPAQTNYSKTDAVSLDNASQHPENIEPQKNSYPNF